MARYYIDNQGQKIECLIRNADWRYNPTEFVYKLSESGESLRGNIDEVKEFGVYETLKYERAEVEIDQSGDLAHLFTEDPNPIFKKETIFLKTLIEGKNTLYKYTAPNRVRYFFKNKEDEIEPLVYKRYLTGKSGIGTNNRYRDQISRNLNCATVKPMIRNASYKERDLFKLFEEYNKCEGSDYHSFMKGDSGKVHLTVQAGINISSAGAIVPYEDISDKLKGNSTEFTAGLEMEYILPSNQNKWGLFFGVQYYSMKAEDSMELNKVSGGILQMKTDYKAVSIPVGIRYYLFLNEQSKLFFEGFYYPRVKLGDSNLIYLRKDDSVFRYIRGYNAYTSFGLGAGYSFMDRFKLTARYITSDKKMFNYYLDSNPVFQLTLGYTIF